MTASSKKGRCCNIGHETRHADLELRFYQVTDSRLCQSASMNNKCQPVNS